MGLLDDDRRVAATLSAARLGVGMGCLLAPGLTGRVMGFPASDVTPSTRVLGRFFAVREAVLGGGSLLWLRDHEPSRALALVNAAVDVGDAAVCLASLVVRGAPRRALLGSAVLALPFAGLWGRIAQRAA